MEKKEKAIYEAPEAEVISVRIERNFLESPEQTDSFHIRSYHEEDI